MVALVFSIISLLACVFLVYVLAQFHRELTRRPGEQVPHLVPGWFPSALRNSAVQGSHYRQQVEFP
jgi:hypothetical protein